jgi:hypothetical protein
VSSSLYYITDHYAPHSANLIQLSRFSRAELERTLRAQFALPRITIVAIFSSATPRGRFTAGIWGSSVTGVGRLRPKVDDVVFAS